MDLVIKDLSTLACVDVEIFCLINLINCLLIKAGLSKSSGPTKCCKTPELRDKGLGAPVLTGSEGGCFGQSRSTGQVSVKCLSISGQEAT